ncbi:MAG: hypothetical protein J6K17_02575 [Oscillospiraceae bacterium]|nr:hypothetical protein [Oscillospiraceae bacterium]
MTATVSTKKNETPRKINPALHNWKSNIKDSRKFTIILFILHLVAVPALALAGIISIYSKQGGDGIEAYVVITICTTALAAFLGIFAAVDSFRCLHDKSVVDMKLALPMNNTQRFLSNFLSGLFTYLAPFFAAQVLSVLLCGYGCLFMDGRTFYRITYDYSGITTRAVEKPYVCDVFGQAMPILLKLIVGGTLCMLMLYVITVLITICCGSKFEAIAYTILINILIPLTIFSVLYSMYDSLYGINAEEIALKVMLYISVFGGICASIDWASQGDMLYNPDFINHGVWVLVFSLIIAALFALCFFLYRKRRAEQVSKPFVFKLAYYIVLVCAMFCIISLFVVEDGEIVPTIIISGIIFMIFEVVTNRGFKKFWMSIIKYAVTFVAVVAIIKVCEATDGFGAVTRVPSVSSVKSIELDYGGFYYDFGLEYDHYTGEYMPNYIIKDKANIETVVNAHQAIVDYYKNDNVYDEYGNYTNEHMTSSGPLTITYNLKTGGSFTREYYNYSAEPTEILTALDVSEEYKIQVAEMYRTYILNIEKYYEEEMERILESEEDDYLYERYNNYEVTVENYKCNFVDSRIGSRSTSVRMDSLVTRDFFTQLADAYYKDIMAINEENYFHSELKNEWHLRTDFTGNGIIIPESFTNTVELLEYFDFGLNRIENLSDEDMYRKLVGEAASSELMLFTEDEYREIYDVDDELTLHAEYSNGMGYDYRYNADVIVYDFDGNLCNLIRESMPRNIVAENGYVICVSGFTGAVPEDLYDIAASIQRSEYSRYQESLYSQLYDELNQTTY